MTNRNDPTMEAALDRIASPDPKHCAVCGNELTTMPGQPSTSTGTLALSCPTIHDPYLWELCRGCYPRFSLSLRAMMGELIRDYQNRKRRAAPLP
jgi:hypothetical protein